MRILLVEDETHLAELLAQSLREEAHEVDVCHDGKVALAQTERVRYDVIVLDWVLPSIDGLAIVRAIATRLGGRVEVVPSERGARFRLSLPA